MTDQPGLWLGEDLYLPPDAVTETFLILGKRGAGKTNAAVVMAEEMITAGSGSPAQGCPPWGTGIRCRKALH